MKSLTRCSWAVYRCSRYRNPTRTVSTSGEYKQDKLKIHSEPPTNVRNDWVGPPDPDSNLRAYRFHIPENESGLQKEYRERREEVMKWNQDYWSKHNRKFNSEKERYIERNLKALGKQESDGEQQKLTAEELSKFYKQFLDDNYSTHANYNKEWYKKNISLLWPALKVKVENLFRK